MHPLHQHSAHQVYNTGMTQLGGQPNEINGVLLFIVQ